MTDEVKYSVTNPVTLEVAKEAAGKVIEKYGADHAYIRPGSLLCYYGPSTALDATESQKQSGCLVGEILAVLGLRSERVADYLGSIMSVEHDLLRGVIHQTALAWMQAIQNAQDNGSPWGECVAEANQREATNSLPAYHVYPVMDGSNFLNKSLATAIEGSVS